MTSTLRHKRLPALGTLEPGGISVARAISSGGWIVSAASVAGQAQPRPGTTECARTCTW